MRKELKSIVALLLSCAVAGAANAADNDGDGVIDQLQASPGGAMTCAIDNTGAQCWGYNIFGERDVPALTNPVQISAGNGHACAIANGALQCWGWNAYGQATPPAVSSPVQLDSGGEHSCVLDANGVQCWGRNDQGQSNVPSLTDPVQISVGGYRTCALDDNGVHCWGWNAYQQTVVPTLSNPVQVSAGTEHTCAIDDNGVTCWGNNAYGESSVPTLVNPKQVVAGNYFSCALDDNGVQCWGANTYGETSVPALNKPVVLLAGGGSHACAIDAEGLQCWGDNSGGQLTVPALVFDNCPQVANADQLDTDGDGAGNACDSDDDNDGTPDTSDAFPLDPTETIDSDTDGTGNNADTDDDNDSVADASDNCPLLANNNQLDADNDAIGDACDPDADGDGVADASDNCLLLQNSNQLDTDSDGKGDACDSDQDGDGFPDAKPQVTAGGEHACALDANGVHCWGSNEFGQATVPALTKPLAVSAGYFHTCALDSAGVKCWGLDTWGQTVVPPLDNAVAVSTSSYISCALDSTGVHCWGDNSFGQLTVPALVNPVAVGAGDYHACALDADGVQCWGDNNLDQANVPLLDNPVALSTGGYHSCALDSTGVHCWGSNNHGETNVPVLDNPVAVSAGYGHTCALDANGVQCWGKNDSGQTSVPPLVNPVAVSAGDRYTCALDANGVQCWGRNVNGQTSVPAGLAFTPADNCPQVANPSQLDTDADGQGDACDSDDDNDGTPDVDDDFPLDDTETTDTDGDNIGDNSDPLINDPATLNALDGGIAKDKVGSSVAFAGDFDGDGYGDYVVGTPGYDIPPAAPLKAIKDAGKAAVISGRNGDVLASVNGSAAKDTMGFAVAGNGDVDNDGYADVLVGAPKADDVANGIKDTGAVVLLYGPDGTRRETFSGPAARSQFGYAVALGDVYGDDGHADILVGAPTAPYADAGFKAAGSVSLFSGSDLSPGPVMYGADKSLFGASLAVGNVQETGGMSAIIGSPGHTNLDNGARRAGAVFVARYGGVFVYSPVRFGLWQNIRLGTAVAAGDLDGDGYDEVLAGAPADDSLDVKQSGSVTIYGSADFELVERLYGATQKAGFGSSIAVGDINADGYGDIIIAAPKYDAWSSKPVKDTGSLTLYSGYGFGFIDILYGDNAKDYFGSAVATGDINSDGIDDLIIGIPGFDAPGDKPVKDAGAARVLNGTQL
jgi:alpha-tubulin suppressor-like RCC1 family protein